MNEFKCKICNKDYDSYKSLSLHMNRSHDVKGDDFYVDYYLNGKWPICVCGCGQKTKWSYEHKNFREFAAVGHLNRVRNNWGNNKKAQEKSAETRRKQYASGERVSWCKGLSIDTDERIKKLAEKVKKSIKTDKEELNRRSELMKLQRKDGTIPTLYREKSSQWKGGISNINQMARGDKRFYDLWKYPILNRDNFKCRKCFNTQDLHIHHDKETFSEIIKKVMTIEDYEHINNFETKKLIVDKVLDYHIKNNISGITLCKNCHNEFHPNLNF